MCEPEEETLDSHNEMCQHNKAWLWLQRRVIHPVSGLPPAAMTVMEMLELYEAQHGPAVDAASVGEPPMCPLHKSLDKRGKLEVTYSHGCIACSLNERTELLDLLATIATLDGSEDSTTVLRRLIERVG